MHADHSLALLSGAHVAVVADVLDRLGHRDQVMGHAIRPIVPPLDGILIGAAHTISCVADDLIRDNPYEHEIAAVDAIGGG